MKLTDTQQKALVSVLEAGELVRWTGGWWTVPNCPVKSRQLSAYRNHALDVPSWSVGVGTINALVKRGYLYLDGRDAQGFPTRAIPTQKAKDLI